MKAQTNILAACKLFSTKTQAEFEAICGNTASHSRHHKLIILHAGKTESLEVGFKWVNNWIGALKGLL